MPEVYTANVPFLLLHRVVAIYRNAIDYDDSTKLSMSFGVATKQLQKKKLLKKGTRQLTIKGENYEDKLLTRMTDRDIEDTILYFETAVLLARKVEG